MLSTVSGGSATTTDIAWNAGRFDSANRASPLPFSCLISAESHGTVEPTIPWKQATRVIGSGPVTCTFIWPIGCSHWSPIAFQNSSSWSANPFIAPWTR